MARYQQYVVEQVENGFLVMPNWVDGPKDLTWVATDLDGLLDVLATVFEQGEGSRGPVVAAGSVGPSPDEEATDHPSGDSTAYNAGDEGEPPPPHAPAPGEGPVDTAATVDLTKYPRVTKAPTGKFSMMCPEHGAHTAVIRAEDLVCTGRTGQVWCKASVPMPVVRLMLGEVAG